MGVATLHIIDEHSIQLEADGLWWRGGAAGECRCASAAIIESIIFFKQLGLAYLVDRGESENWASFSADRQWLFQFP